MIYLIKCDGTFLAKSNPKTGMLGFYLTKDEQSAINLCARLNGILGKMTYVEVAEDKVADYLSGGSGNIYKEDSNIKQKDKPLSPEDVLPNLDKLKPLDQMTQEEIRKAEGLE